MTGGRRLLSARMLLIALAMLAGLVAMNVPAGAAESVPQEGSAPWSGTCANPDSAAVDDDTRSACTFGQTVVASNFDLQSLVPPSATEIGFIVDVRGRTNDPAGSDVFDVSLSKNAGGSFSPIVATGTVESDSDTSNPDTFVPAPSDGACNTFGTTWSRNDLANADFRIRVAAHPRVNATTDAPAETMQIDDIDVRVCWAARKITNAAGGAASPGANVGASLTVDHTGVDALDGSRESERGLEVDQLPDQQRADRLRRYRRQHERRHRHRVLPDSGADGRGLLRPDPDRVQRRWRARRGL